MKLVLVFVMLSSSFAFAGEFEDRVAVGQARENAEIQSVKEGQRARAFAVFNRLVAQVVKNRFGGAPEGIPAASGDAVDSWRSLMTEMLAIGEFKTGKNLVCHAWGIAMCRDRQCSLDSTKVECVDPSGHVTNSGWLKSRF